MAGRHGRRPRSPGPPPRARSPPRLADGETVEVDGRTRSPRRCLPSVPATISSRNELSGANDRQPDLRLRQDVRPHPDRRVRMDPPSSGGPAQALGPGPAPRRPRAHGPAGGSRGLQRPGPRGSARGDSSAGVPEQGVLPQAEPRTQAPHAGVDFAAVSGRDGATYRLRPVLADRRAFQVFLYGRSPGSPAGTGGAPDDLLADRAERRPRGGVPAWAARRDRTRRGRGARPGSAPAFAARLVGNLQDGQARRVRSTPTGPRFTVAVSSRIPVRLPVDDPTECPPSDPRPRRSSSAVSSPSGEPCSTTSTTLYRPTPADRNDLLSLSLLSLSRSRRSSSSRRSPDELSTSSTSRSPITPNRRTNEPDRPCPPPGRPTDGPRRESSPGTTSRSRSRPDLVVNRSPIRVDSRCSTCGCVFRAPAATRSSITGSSASGSPRPSTPNPGLDQGDPTTTEAFLVTDLVPYSEPARVSTFGDRRPRRSSSPGTSPEQFVPSSLRGRSQEPSSPPDPPRSELGLESIASLNKIHVVDSQPTLAAGAHARSRATGRTRDLARERARQRSRWAVVARGEEHRPGSRGRSTARGPARPKNNWRQYPRHAHRGRPASSVDSPLRRRPRRDLLRSRRSATDFEARRGDRARRGRRRRRHRSGPPGDVPGSGSDDDGDRDRSATSSETAPAEGELDPRRPDPGPARPGAGASRPPSLPNPTSTELAPALKTEGRRPRRRPRSPRAIVAGDTSQADPAPRNGPCAGAGVRIRCREAKISGTNVTG